MGSCKGVNLGEKLESNLTIFDSMEGLQKFVHERIPHWAIVSFHESSRETIERFFKEKTNISTFLSARDFFIENLQSRLINKANDNGSNVNDCEMEVANIIDAMSSNKIYNLFNDNFHKTLIDNSLPLKAASTSNYIEILMLISLPTIKKGTGVCKTYEQEGANNVVKVTICN
jgi:hypothetical protein